MVQSAFAFDDEFMDYAREALTQVSEPSQQIVESTLAGADRNLMVFDNWTVAVPLRFFLTGETFDPSGGYHFAAANGKNVLDVELGHGGDPRGFIRKLMARYSKEIREILCKPTSAKGAAAALGVWLCKLTGIAEPFGVACAVLFIVSIAEATQNTFCKASDQEIMARIPDRWGSRDLAKVAVTSSRPNDVFISYSRDDLHIAKAVERTLNSQGLKVFIDTSILGGDDWRSEISRHLESSRLILVLWSTNSIVSPWVQQEAQVGLDRGILFPVAIDGVNPPIGFRHVQHVPISWAVKGSKADLSIITGTAKHRLSLPEITVPPSCI